MPRYALKIEYHGGPFHGWQRQNDLQTVQGTIDEAVRRLDKKCEGIQGAGRTDAGVHATGQVAHLDLGATWDPFRLSEALNYHLRPHPIAVVDAAEVDDDFHARFSAHMRHYLFRVFVRRAPATHQAGLVWQVRHELDVDAMREGARHLIGEHDFTTFRSSICQSKSPVKSLDVVELSSFETQGGTEIRFELSARSFLHNQVRSIVGTLERVGAGAWSPDDVRVALEACDRTACGPVCSPDGLYLTKVEYPDAPFDT